MKSRYGNLVAKTLLACSIFSISLMKTAKSQHLSFADKVEVGVNFGPTFFLGDLGGNAGYGTKFIKDVNLELTKVMRGGFISIYPTEWLGLRLAGQITYVEGRDNIINTDGINELWRKQRNLDFRSKMWEVYSAVEFHPLVFLNRNDEEGYRPKISPYGFVGFGVFHFDPEGSLVDQNGVRTWHKLHPLRTEGQGMTEYPEKKPYTLTQYNIPLGGGVKIALGERFNTSFELLYRQTFTDYIDDVSTSYIDPDYFERYLTPAQADIARQIHDKTVGIITPGINRYEPGTQRGNVNNNDAYFSLLIKFGFRFGGNDDDGGGLFGNSANRRAKRQTRCPHFY